MVFFLFRLLFNPGMSQGDDLAYTAIANRIANGITIPSLYIFDLRWAVVLPTALLYKLFGVSDLTSQFFSFVFSLGSLYFVYRIARRHAGARAALLGMILYGSIPLVSLYSGFLQVCPVLEFTGLGTVFFWQQFVSGHKLRYLLSAGLLAGLLPLSRITGVFLFPLLLAYSLYVRRQEGERRWRVLLLEGRWFLFFCVLSTWAMLVQGIVYLSLYNNFFYHFTVSKAAVALQNATEGMDPKDWFFYIETFFRRAGFADWRFFGIFGFLLPVFTGFQIFTQNRKGLLFLFWFLFLFLAMSMAPSSLDPYRPLIRNIRYATVFLAPLAILYAVLLVDGWRRRGKWRILAGGIGATLLSVNLGLSVHFQLVYANRYRERCAIHAFIKESGVAPVYVTDHDFPRYYGYLERYGHTTMRSIRSLSSLDEAGVLVFHHNVHPDRSVLLPDERAQLLDPDSAPLPVLKRFRGVTVFEADPVYLVNTGKRDHIPGIAPGVTVDFRPGHFRRQPGTLILQRQPMLRFGNGWAEGDQVCIHFSAPAEMVTVLLQVQEGFSARLLLRTTVAPDYGVARIRIADLDVTVDGYCERIEPKDRTLGVVELGAGTHALQVECVGRDPSSTGFFFGLDNLMCLPGDVNVD